MKIPSVHITKDKKNKMNKILGVKGMKIGIRKPSIKKTISTKIRMIFAAKLSNGFKGVNTPTICIA